MHESMILNKDSGSKDMIERKNYIRKILKEKIYVTMTQHGFGS